ncbi:class I SAM-dependent methyltransferase [Streptomyces diacarni]|uniref:class I SAM-dependent methyltransferase n=1 Tax=Streptomyces diacarni TaxID=2800381 RepID=UPI0034119D74
MGNFYDYAPYAPTYAARPDYVPEALRALLRVADVTPGDLVCDVGAGAGHLTEPLLQYGLRVHAVEPTRAMRAEGEARTADYDEVTWHSGTGEESGRPPGSYRLVTFGSCFDLMDRPAALAETARILGQGGSFACLWNHRDLDDPLQARIEALIHEHVPGYGYGIRRSDQRPVIEESGLFEPPVHLSARRVVRLRADAWCDAWASHATLGRQAGTHFRDIVAGIRELVNDAGDAFVDVPYVTRVWVARTADRAGRR